MFQLIFLSISRVKQQASSTVLDEKEPWLLFLLDIITSEILMNDVEFYFNSFITFTLFQESLTFALNFVSI